jgi:hypothetical protein
MTDDGKELIVNEICYVAMIEGNLPPPVFQG